MKDNDHGSILVENNRNLREFIVWQQNRYHHIQSLSQGLFGSILAVIAIVATIVTTTYQLIPGPPSDEQVYISAAEGVPLVSIGPVTAALTISLNMLLSFVLLTLAAIILIISLYKLYLVTIGQQLHPKIPVESNILMMSEQTQNRLFTGVNESSLTSEFPSSIVKNQRLLETANRRFTNSVLRFPLALLLGIAGISIYFQSINAQLVNLLALNISFLIPTSIYIFVGQKLLSTDEQKTQSNEIHVDASFKSKPIFEGSKINRWSQVEFTRYETLLLILNTVISFIVVLAWIVSITT